MNHFPKVPRDSSGEKIWAEKPLFSQGFPLPAPGQKSTWRGGGLSSEERPEFRRKRDSYEPLPGPSSSGNNGSSALAIRFQSRPLLRYQTHYFNWHLEVSTKARLLKHDFPVHGNGGGKTYRAIFGGRGKRNFCWRPQKMGLVWSVPISSEENDRAWTDGGGVLWYVFPSLSFPPPFAAL